MAEHTLGRLPTEHYVARLTLEKVERTVDKNVHNGRQDRVVDEVTTLTIKEKDLSVLITKLGLHLEIVNRFPDEDEDDF